MKKALTCVCITLNLQPSELRSRNRKVRKLYRNSITLSFKVFSNDSRDNWTLDPGWYSLQHVMCTLHLLHIYPSDLCTSLCVKRAVKASKLTYCLWGIKMMSVVDSVTAVTMYNHHIVLYCHMMHFYLEVAYWSMHSVNKSNITFSQMFCLRSCIKVFKADGHFPRISENQSVYISYSLHGQVLFRWMC